MTNVTGLIRKRLQEKLSEKMVNHIIGKNKSLESKLNFLLKECYGFKVSKEFPRQFKQLQDDNKIRNKIVHDGIFSKRPTAEKAVQNVEELIINLNNKITERGLEAT